MVTGRSFGVFSYRKVEESYDVIVRHLSRTGDDVAHVCDLYVQRDRIECFVCPLGQVFTWFQSFDDFRFDSFNFAY